MSENVVNNGARVDVEFGFYKGRAGMVMDAGGVLRVSVLAPLPRGNKVPTDGTVDGKRMEVLAVDRGTLDRQFTVLTIREIPEEVAAEPDGGNEDA